MASAGQVPLATWVKFTLSVLTYTLYDVMFPAVVPVFRCGRYSSMLILS